MNNTYIIKLDLNDISMLNISDNTDQININKLLNNVIKNLNNIETNSIHNNDVVIMNKSEYVNYIFSNYGSKIIYINDCEQNSQYICPICKDDYIANEQLYKLTSCNHIFHSDCILEWFNKLSISKFNTLSCPLCRNSNELMI